MATQCPYCHQTLEDDAVCCAGLTFTWKCKSCHKVTQGFAIPYGRCHLCGGELEVQERPTEYPEEVLTAIQQGLIFEANSHHFYRLAAQKTSDARMKEIFQDFAEKEIQHYETLSEKYHLHDKLAIDENFDRLIMDYLFHGIDFNDAASLRTLYDQGIKMEERTRDFYLAQAEKATSPSVQEVYRELAAEEEEHKAILEAERDAFHPEG